MSGLRPIRTAAAVAVCKLTRGALRLLKRGGTALPGKAALVFSPEVLRETSRGVETIVVTGTNGKTTTCRLLEQALRAAGKEPLANSSGANLLSGITAEFACGAGLDGKARSRFAVIECDEAALRHVVPLIRPRVIVVTNLFRDQLDRYGEVMHTREVILEGIREVPESILCLNADDSLTASLGEEVPNSVFYYGLDTPAGEGKEPAVSDARRCIRCGGEYRYNYHTYAHLGGFFCPRCGYSRPRAAVAVTAVDGMSERESTVHMRLGEEIHEVRIALPAVYNLYNSAAAVCAWTAAGYPAEEMLKTLGSAVSGFGRMEEFVLDGVPVRMILVKNPAGCSQTLDYLGMMETDHRLVLCLNDRTADGHDVSWIWDAEFEKLAEDPRLQRICISGDRKEEMALRLRYAGVDMEKTEEADSEAEILAFVRESGVPVCILPNYTAMLALRSALREAAGGKEFWKG